MRLCTNDQLLQLPYGTYIRGSFANKFSTRPRKIVWIPLHPLLRSPLHEASFYTNWSWLRLKTPQMPACEVSFEMLGTTKALTSSALYASSIRLQRAAHLLPTSKYQAQWIVSKQSFPWARQDSFRTDTLLRFLLMVEDHSGNKLLQVVTWLLNVPMLLQCKGRRMI